MEIYELTYANTPRTDEHSGGWGVVETTSQLTPQQRARLESGVVTTIEELHPTDEFAGQEELAARAVVLTYRPCDAGGTWWHSVPAGSDATGRPGNVFTHAVATDDLAEVRPIDLWRSAHWLSPFGVLEVGAASLAGQPPFAFPAEETLDLTTRSPGAVECVISAVTWCFQNDRALVLAAASQDGFVDWLRLVTRLTSASVASQIPFCTFVRAADLATRPPKFEILGMSVQELDLAQRVMATASVAKALVLDLEQLPDETVNEFWISGGQQWNAGQRWQDAFYRLLDKDAAEVTATLRTMDELVRDVSPQDVLSPDWPLALAVFRRAGADHPEAAEIGDDWRRLAPWDGLADPELIDLLDVGARDRSADEIAASTDDSDIAKARLSPDLEAFRSSSSDAAERATVADHLGRIDRYSGDWRVLLEELIVARPELASAELVDTWARVYQVEAGLVMRGGPPPEVEEALRLWLRTVPLLALREGAQGSDRNLAEAAVLMVLGVGLPYGADPVQVARVEALLAASSTLATSLVELLIKWQHMHAAHLEER